MHELWNGALSFGLITIPVALYSASKERALNFSMLRKNDLCPISYKRVCKTTGEEVPLEDIVKGFQYSEHKYVVLDKEDFKRANPEKSERIDIDTFVLESEIPSKYYDKPYFLAPGKGGDKAYLLLREALAQEKKVGIATMVFREREDLVAIKPDGDLLFLLQLRYPDELRESKGIAVSSHIAIKRDEIKMAIELIEKMSGKFHPESYHDTYIEKLEKIIKDKARGKKLKELPKEALQVSPTTDLVAQLKASLAKQHHS